MDPAALLAAFRDLARPGPWLHRHQGGDGPRVVLVVCTHGDEVGPLPAAIELIRDLRAGRLQFAGELSVLVGNPEAVAAGRRGLDSDLNRVFVAEPPDDREGRRARELKPILERADLLLDLHQTGAPTASAFYILPYDRAHGDWARALAGAPLWITRPADQAFSPSTCCVDEFVRLQGRIGLTLELSEKGLDPQTEAHAGRVMRRLLELAVDPRPIAELAAQQPEPEYLVLAHREPFGDPSRRLRPGLRNLEPVRAGQRLSPEGAEEVVCPVDGRLLFPKYPRRDEQGRALAPLPEELYRVVVPPPGHPKDLWAG